MLITKHKQCQNEADRVAIVNSGSSRLGWVSQKRGASGKRSQSRASSEGAGQRNCGAAGGRSRTLATTAQRRGTRDRMEIHAPGRGAQALSPLSSVIMLSKYECCP